jgi:murein DD-endopeptidase MepM/ murein hydrolase activator NlpD
MLGRLGKRRGDMFSDDGVAPAGGGGFRWLVSTSLAAAVGAISVAAVIFGSGETTDALREVPPWLERPGAKPSVTAARDITPTETGLKWAIPKADRLQTMTGTLSARFLVHDTMRIKQGTRDAIVNKAFVRLVARLAPVAPGQIERIPPFNPYRLYATAGAADDTAGQNATDDAQEISTTLIELLGGLLPAEDGQELDAQEAAEIVARSLAVQDEPATGIAAIRGGFQPDGLKATAQELLADRSLRGRQDRLPTTATTDLTKTVFDTDDTVADLEARQVKVVKVARGQTFTRILQDNGGDKFQVRAMVEAAKTILADNALTPGMEAHVTLVPSLTRAGALEPVRVTLFSEQQDHKLTVARNAAGEFSVSATPIEDRVARADVGNDDNAQASSLYMSFYHSALSHGLPVETINQIMRIHAYDTDFRRRVRGHDQIEWFFDTRDDTRAAGNGLDAALGDLLMTSISTGGEAYRFYRFRTQDGLVDYYDDNGNTSRKFLMRRPVRGESMRLASGFGMRRHPILQYVRPHNGIDWAGPIGTPIMAAGMGTIEEAGRKGEFGNYVRIRHANGYKTSYAHMQRFAPGVSEGVRVLQGQVIGYLGNTGLSSGPHLHYEVHVNSRPVDPMSIQVPRDRKLTTNQLRDFQREKTRIDDLLRRNPVSSRIVDQQAALR